MTCAECKYVEVILLGKTREALRCTNKRNGKWCGRIVDMFPAGSIPSDVLPPPKWCEYEHGANEQQHK